jgi:hypothetical protein
MGWRHDAQLDDEITVLVRRLHLLLDDPHPELLTWLESRNAAAHALHEALGRRLGPCAPWWATPHAAAVAVVDAARRFRRSPVRGTQRAIARNGLYRALDALDISGADR